MDLSASVWLLIALAILSANVPFFNQRLFAIVPFSFAASKGRKPLWLRLVELLVLYFLVGALGWAIESRVGSVFKQGWEFYAVTFCLFIVAAYPGFVFQYLRRGARA